MVGTALQQCALITEMAVEQADYYINNNGQTLDGVGESSWFPAWPSPPTTWTTCPASCTPRAKSSL